MNFLETLMLYMSLTFAGGVQDAPLTTPTPTPTATPTVITDTMLADQTTATPTIVPTATPTVSPVPTPTISPNPAYAILRYGDRNDEVKKMQKRLIELGYLSDKADGVYGFNTRRAVILFQKAHGLSPDGDAGRVTLTFLYEYEDVKYNPDAPTPTATPEETPAASVGNTAGTETPVPDDDAAVPTETPAATITPNPAYKLLNYGDSGSSVRTLQKRLVELGYLNGGVDGKYGNNTRNAVKKFQEVHGLAADGEAGRVTQTWLFEYEGVIYNPDAVNPNPAVTPTEVPADAPPETLMSPQKDVVVTLDNQGAIFCLQEIDGVTVKSAPRVYRYYDGRIFVSLFDLALAVDEWNLVTDDAAGQATLSCNGRTVVFTITEDGFTWQADGGKAVAANPADASQLFGDTMVSTGVLEAAFGFSMTWDEDECALMINTGSTQGAAG